MIHNKDIKIKNIIKKKTGANKKVTSWNVTINGNSLY